MRREQLNYRLLPLLAVAGALLFAAPANAEPPATGVFIEARLSSINLPGAEGVIGGLGGPAPATIGYRADGFTIGVGPAIHRFTQSTSTCPFDPVNGGCTGGEDMNRSTSLMGIGADFVATFTLAKVHEERGEFYLLGGLLLGAAFVTEDDGNDIPAPEQTERGSPLVFGGTAGVGIRYFLAPFVAIGAELGEGYTNIPFDSSSTRSERVSAFATWGAFTTQLVF